MVICLERGADLHTAQLMPLPLTVSCFSKIQIGFTYLVLAHPGSPGCVLLNIAFTCKQLQKTSVSAQKLGFENFKNCNDVLTFSVENFMPYLYLGVIKLVLCGYAVWIQESHVVFRQTSSSVMAVCNAKFTQYYC